jgi:hypothetical protein
MASLNFLIIHPICIRLFVAAKVRLTGLPAKQMAVFVIDCWLLLFSSGAIRN